MTNANGLQEKSRGLLAAGMLITVIATPGHAEELVADAYTSYYDMEVLSYCSLGGEAATAGHERTVARLLAAGLSQEDHEEARMEAWTDAYREWLNRGLGGFRGWCREEGAAAVKRLERAP